MYGGGITFVSAMQKADDWFRDTAAKQLLAKASTIVTIVLCVLLCSSGYIRG